MPLLLADASPIIAFCNGNQHTLLAGVVRATYGWIEVPHLVNTEVQDRCSRVGAENYLTMKAQGVIRPNREAVLYGNDDDILLHVLDLLDLEEGDVRARLKDGGEAFAVAYAVRHQKHGAEPCILMDDRKGRDWARRAGIPVLPTLWVFQEAKRRKLITTSAQMRVAYEAVARFTQALRTLAEEPQLLADLS